MVRSKDIEVDQRESGACWVTIDRAHKHNALARSVLAELADAVSLAGAASETRVVVLTGAGERFFAPGGDLLDLASVRDEPATREMTEQARRALANLGGDPNIAPERHPLVAQAQAALDRAQLNLSYTVICAPTDGVVAKVEQLQVGDTIAASAPVVSTRDVWIEANFKEGQRARMRPGQVATVEIDRYPGRRFSAEVTSVSPGTGSQFSLLPPENATGNWVKVVQRVPVRLQLAHVDAGFLLQAGLSADVSVDTHSREPELAAATGPTTAGVAR